MPLPFRSPDFPLADGVAVVTGAASGIGRATALALAARGCHLALTDRDADGLAETARHAESQGLRVTQHVFDVTDAEAVAALPQAVEAAHGRVTMLVNNAGVSLYGRVEEISMDDLRWLFEINFFAVAALTKVFLPALKRQPAQIVTVSSFFGLMAPPGQAAYAASKFAVRGFSEALRHELERSPVGVTVVHPGGVNTAIATNARMGAGADPAKGEAMTARFAAALRLSPDVAATQIVRAIERRKPRLVIGSDARFGDRLQRLMPGRYWSVMRSQFAAISGRR